GECKSGGGTIHDSRDRVRGSYGGANQGIIINPGQAVKRRVVGIIIPDDGHRNTSGHPASAVPLGARETLLIDHGYARVPVIEPTGGIRRSEPLVFAWNGTAELLAPEEGISVNISRIQD